MDHPGLNAEFIFSDLPSGTQRSYGEYPIYNAAGEDIPPLSLVEVTGTCSSTGGTGRSHFKVEKPSADGLKQVLVCQLGLPTGWAGKGSLDFMHSGLAIRYDPDDGDPAIGDSVGTKSGSFKAKKGASGFTVLKVNTTAIGTDPTGKTVFCALAGGSGGALTIVQTTGAGSSGAVTAKAIVMNANPADSPNFSQTGDTLNLNYFKL